MKKIYVIGFGAGDESGMTLHARKLLRDCDIIVGYSTYAELMRKLFPEKEFFTTPMKGERQRCEKAFEFAENGMTAAVISSGDSGVYGMASLVCELAEEHPGVDIEIAPGVTAALSGGALLGAPLGHDFAVVSLSDLLTPWEIIEKRLKAVGMGDFAVAIYNPESKTRKGYLKKACGILMEYKSPDTISAIVTNIGREGEAFKIMRLKELAEYPADMFSTAFVGNSKTREINGRMVTPRGYEL